MKFYIYAGVVLLILSACTEASSPDSSSRIDSEGESRSLASVEEDSAAFFTSVTEVAGLSDFRHDDGSFGEKWFPEIMGSGGGFLDYNGDGSLDIVLVGGGSLPSRPIRDVLALSLYRNDGDGTFTNVTSEAGLSDVRAYGMGVSVGDYDNDSDPDVLLTTLRRNLLFENQEGAFQEVGRAAGLGDRSRWSTSSAFFDADRDGNLDLYVANYVKWSPEIDVDCVHDDQQDYCNPRRYRGIGDTYYRNQGDGTFVEVTEESGFLEGIDVEAAKGLGVAELDMNGDGLSDLYVANDGSRNFLYRNDGDGTFTERALRRGVALNRRGSPRAGMGVDVGVVDSTEEISIFVGNFSQESVSFWRQESGGFFTDRATVSGAGYPTRQTLTFGLQLFDVDLDTDLDLMLANGNVIEQIASMHRGVSFRERPQLFLNRGNGHFEEVSPGRGVLTKKMLARGLAVGDVDGDGDQDVLITESDGPAHLLRNDRAGEHYLRVRVEGLSSNRDGIGTRVRARIGELVMERVVRGGDSYLSQSEKTMTFGLGSAREVDELSVHWPDGQVQRFQDLASRQEVLIVQGREELRRVDSLAKEPKIKSP